MTRVLDPLAIYERGLVGLDSLSGVERLVYILQDFDNIMEMEGWDHFFLHEYHFAWYSEMKDWLHRIGDRESLALLSDYVNYLASRGFEFSPTGVETLLMSNDEECNRTCPDWSNQYSALRTARWNMAEAFLRRQGLAFQSE